MAITTAFAMTAFGGTSTAMAESTLLCNKNTPTPAPTGAECEPTKHIHFLSVIRDTEGKHVIGKTKLLSGSNTVECNVLLLGDVAEPFLSSPVKISATLTYSGCNLGCTVRAADGATDIPGTVDILRLGTEELVDVTLLEFLIKKTCPFVFTCDYIFDDAVGHGLPLNGVVGGLPHVTYSSATDTLEQKLSGPFNCPTTASLDALFQSLTQFYIRA
jgi:hypothetical protein